MQGFLLLNKPRDLTSYGAVARIKRLSGEKRVGHTGTLDPLATGVLPILLGRATALSSYLLDADKSYRAKIKLGIETDSCDITGEVVAKSEKLVTNEELSSALDAFRGKIMQAPPIFSALKKDGVRLYTLARKGETIDIPEREVEIYKIELLSPEIRENEFEIAVSVSKGTYIRSLARDIGRYLGCYATLTELTRTETGGFSLSECSDLEELESDFSAHLLSPDRAVSHLPELTVTKAQAKRFCNGGQLDLERLKLTDYIDGELYRIKYENELLGLGFVDTKKNQMAIRCVISER